MEQKRKIVVPLEPETPHFDAEETLLSARPVVPLNQGETQATSRQAQSFAHAPFYGRLPFLVLVVVAAVAVGALGGLGFARYRYQQRNTAPVAVQPSTPVQAPVAADTRTATVQTPDRAEPEAQSPSVPEVKIEDKATDDEAASVDNENAEKAPAPRPKASDDADDKKADDKKADDKKRDDNIRVAPSAPRDRPRADDDDEYDYPTRAQRRERRRSRDDDEAIDVPRRVERAGEQINRIREIFEGRQQRP